MMVILINLP